MAACAVVQMRAWTRNAVMVTTTWRSLPSAVLAGFALCALLAPAMAKGPSIPDETVLPSRPPGAELSTQEGILLRYAVRAQAGTLTLKTAQGQEVVFRFGLPVRIDGRDVACRTLPSSAPTAPDTCPDWPANVAVGYTRVRVSYWQAKLPDTDKAVQVIAEVTLLSTSAALPGITRINAR